MAAPRSERIYPDSTILTENGPLNVVSDERMLEATAKATLAQSLVGGGFSVIVDRAPTGFPGEYVTVGAAIQLQAALKAERAVQVAFPQGVPEEDGVVAEEVLRADAGEVLIESEPAAVGAPEDDES